MAITITQVRNAVSLQTDNLRMKLEINHPNYGWIPYHLNPADTDTTIDNAAVLTLIGSNFTAYVPPTQAELDAEKAAYVREERDSLLFAVIDPLVSNPLRWADLTSDKQSEWTQYRTDLLNITDQSGFPQNVIWPIQPE